MSSPSCPDATLRTTLIAGFPGETDEQFERARATSSERPAFRLRGRLPLLARGGHARAEPARPGGRGRESRPRPALRDAADAVCAPRVAERVGRELDVLVEGREEDGAAVRPRAVPGSRGGRRHATSTGETRAMSSRDASATRCSTRWKGSDQGHGCNRPGAAGFRPTSCGRRPTSSRSCASASFRCSWSRSSARGRSGWGCRRWPTMRRGAHRRRHLHPHIVHRLARRLPGAAAAAR